MTETKTILREMQCGTCGVWHAIPQVMYDSCVEEGGFWHCPNGHRRGWDKGRHEREKQVNDLRRERDRLTQQLAYKDDLISDERRRREETERALAAQKGQVTKLRKRAGAGVCPCCNRTFAGLARHMTAKHPGFKAEEAA